MKIFLDTAKIEEIKNAVDMGLCDGVTTNPSLVAKTGKTFEEVIKEITAIVDGPISLEVTAEDSEGMISQAHVLADKAPNVVVKIPMTKEGIKAVKTLEKQGIKTNVTLIFQPIQALIAAKAGASYVSPFIGRLDDISSEGMTIVNDIMEMFLNYEYSTEVIVASVRHPMHVYEAALIGADICTIPYPVLMKLFNHPLTDIGLAKFMEDWKKVPE